MDNFNFAVNNNEQLLDEAEYTRKVEHLKLELLDIEKIKVDEKDVDKVNYLSAIFSYAHEMQKVLKMLIDYNIEIEDVENAARQILLSIKKEYQKFIIYIDKEKEQKYLKLFNITKDKEK